MQQIVSNEDRIHDRIISRRNLQESKHILSLIARNKFGSPNHQVFGECEAAYEFTYKYHAISAVEKDVVHDRNVFGLIDKETIAAAVIDDRVMYYGLSMSMSMSLGINQVLVDILDSQRCFCCVKLSASMNLHSPKFGISVLKCKLIFLLISIDQNSSSPVSHTCC